MVISMAARHNLRDHHVKAPEVRLVSMRLGGHGRGDRRAFIE